MAKVKVRMFNEAGAELSKPFWVEIEKHEQYKDLTIEKGDTFKVIKTE